MKLWTNCSQVDAAALGASPLAAVLSGNSVPEGADPFAACYGGFQFGSWAGQLGDGRAICLGEVQQVCLTACACRLVYSARTAPGGAFVCVTMGGLYEIVVQVLGGDVNNAVSASASGRLEVQLKGCGTTPYSRFADGRAVGLQRLILWWKDVADLADL